MFVRVQRFARRRQLADGQSGCKGVPQESELSCAAKLRTAVSASVVRDGSEVRAPAGG